MSIELEVDGMGRAFKSKVLPKIVLPRPHTMKWEIRDDNVNKITLEEPHWFDYPMKNGKM